MKYLCRLAGIPNGKCGIFFLSKWGHIKAPIILVKALATDVAVKSILLLLVTGLMYRSLLFPSNAPVI